MFRLQKVFIFLLFSCSYAFCLVWRAWKVAVVKTSETTECCRSSEDIWLSADNARQNAADESDEPKVRLNLCLLCFLETKYASIPNLFVKLWNKIPHRLKNLSKTNFKKEFQQLLLYNLAANGNHVEILMLSLQNTIIILPIVSWNL